MPPTAIIYCRCSTEEQKLSGLGMSAQEQAVRAECARRGLAVVAVYRDQGVSGSVPPEKRDGLSAAICALDAGEAGVLMVSRVDRLGRSFADLALLAPLAERAGWGITALNSPLDGPMGKMMWALMAVFAELERDLVKERTRTALQVKKAQGAKLGRPSQVSQGARCRLRELRGMGLSWAEIARRMNELGVPSGCGESKWHAASAQRLAAA
jgi:DNA invertase Pin-like site-specific DNA recombinase